jgi:hypothetical protein
MTTTTTTKPDVRFLVDVAPADGSKYLTAQVTVVYVSDGHIRNPLFSGYDPDGVAALAELHIDAQASKDSEDFYFSWNAFHYKQVYDVDLRRAESMVKTLRKVERYMEKKTQTQGYPEDFAEYVTRVAAALGYLSPRQSFIAHRVSPQGYGWSYDEQVYEWMNTDELRSYLRNRLEQWKEGA